MPNDKYLPPDPDKGDAAYAAGRALLSAIPVAGGAAVEIFQYIITPPIEKRRNEWMKIIGEALKDLENAHFNLEKLQSDQRFITIVVHATTVAIRNHQQEKLIALRNAITNSAKHPDFNEDIELLFVRYIDELSPSHLKLLTFFVADAKNLTMLKSYSQLYQRFSVEHPNSMPRDEFRMLLQDLSVRGLIRISPDIDDFEDIYQASALLLEGTPDNLPRAIVTDIARKFLDFITVDNHSTV